VFYWRPYPKFPIVIVEENQADTVANFFVKENVYYLWFFCSIKQIKDINFWTQNLQHSADFSQVLPMSAKN